VTASRRVAALDIGTNTCLLLVAEGTPDAPVAVVERATITRLGKGVDKSGRLADDAIDRTARALEGYADEIRRAGVTSIDAVCTSAARDATNGAEFLERATRALGVTPRIIDGDEEARLTFDGALTGLRTQSAVTVFDIGGGSTEVIHGSRAGATVILDALSMDVGSVRLTERHVAHDPPTVAELDAVRRDALAALARAPRAATTELVGVAGTITTLSAIEKSLSVYDAGLVHGATLSRSAVATQIERLASVNLEERKRVTGLDPGRADVIVAGAIIALAILDWAGFDHVLVSDRGVRWGLASRALGGTT
jgi:exopolyphosphatase/guanosine-5'-triphosphate,3'-diphosphate pyrophosphatase